MECKGALKAKRNVGIGLHKVFKTVVINIFKDLPPLVESGSEVSHFIPEPRNFAKVTNFSDNVRKPWLKETQKDIKTYLKIRLSQFNIQRMVNL